MNRYRPHRSPTASIACPTVPGHVGAHVDHGVPGAGRERGVVTDLPVADASLRLREQVRRAATAVEQRYVVAAVEGVGDDGATDKAGAAEDEKAHARDPTITARRWRTCY